MLKILANTVEAYKCADEVRRTGILKKPKHVKDLSKFDEVYYLFEMMATPAIPSIKIIAVYELKKTMPDHFIASWKFYCADERRKLLKILKKAIYDKRCPQDLFKQLIIVCAKIARITTVDNVQTWKESWKIFYKCVRVRGKDEVDNTNNFAHVHGSGLEFLYNAPVVLGCRVMVQLSDVMDFLIPSFHIRKTKHRTIETIIRLYSTHLSNETIKNTLKPFAISGAQICIENIKDGESLEVNLPPLVEFSVKDPVSMITVSDVMFPVLSEVIQNTTKTKSERGSCLQILTSIVEANSLTIMLPHHENAVREYVISCFQLIADVGDSHDWKVSSDDSEDPEELSIVGMIALERIAIATNAEKLYPHVRKCYKEYIKNESWKKVYAATRAVATVSQYMSIPMKPDLDWYMLYIGNMFLHKHPRVKYASTHALGKFCADFQPTIQEGYHKLIISLLFNASESELDRRITSRANVSLSAFFDGAPEKIVTNSLAAHLKRIIALFDKAYKGIDQTKNHETIHTVLLMIGSLAVKLRQAFRKSFNTVNDVFVKCIKKSEAHNYTSLFAFTLDCLSTVATACGKDISMSTTQYALRVANQFFKKVEVNDPNFRRIVNGAQKMANLLGDDFEPYLKVFMRSLTKAAEFDYDVNGALRQDNEGCDNKIFAANVIIQLIMTLGDLLEPYRNRLVDLTRKNLKMRKYYSAQHTAADLMPTLVLSICDSEKKQALVATFVVDVKNFLRHNNDAKVSTLYLEAISYIVEACTVGSLVEICGSDLASIAVNEMMVYYKRHLEISLRSYEENFACSEHEREDAYIENHKDHLASIHSFFRRIMLSTEGTCLAECIPLIGKAIDLFKNSDLDYERQLSLRLMCHAIEGYEENVLEYIIAIPEMIGAAMEDVSYKVRAEAAYAVEILAKRSKDVPDYFDEAIQYLSNLMAQIEESDDSNHCDEIIAAESSVAAVVRLIRVSDPSMECIKEAKRRFLSWMPVQHEPVGNLVAYEYLADEYHRQSPEFFDDKDKTLPQILGTCLVAISRGIPGESGESNRVKAKIAMVIGDIYMRNNTKAFNKILEGCQIDDHQKRCLSLIIQTHKEKAARPNNRRN